MMRHLVLVLALAAAAGSAVAAHHSYASYETDRTIEVEGVLEAISWAAPHALLRIRAEGRLYVFEWRAPAGLARTGIRDNPFTVGDRLVAAGNPHRDLATNGVVNLTSVRRPADGFEWKNRRD